MQSSLPRALLALLAVLILLEFLVIAPRLEVAVLVGAAVWMALPGVVLARRFFATRPGSTTPTWLVGPALGFAFSVFGAFLIWAAGLQNWLAIAGGPGLTFALAWACGRFGVPTLRLPAFDRRDVIAVVFALLVVPAITWAPYDHVRESTPEGDAYRAYFTADFVWAMTVTAELAKGDLPPQNPFLKDGQLNYYWMSHFLSGAMYRNVKPWGVLAEQVILVNGVCFGLAFVAFLYALMRAAGASAAFAALGVIVGFVANSYEAVNHIWAMREAGEPLELLRNINIDAVTRWFYKGMPVDGLQRLLLYQPHHLTGYVVALAALWLVAMSESVAELSLAVTVGLLLAMAFLFSTFTALLVGAGVAALYAIRLIAAGKYQAVIVSGVLCGGLAALGALLTRILGYTDPRAGSMMTFGPNPVAMREWPLMLFLSFGPLLAAGVVGLLRIGWVRREGAAPAMLAVVALAFYFLVDVEDMDGVWVGWRSGHQLLVAFSAMGAAACTVAWRRRAWRVPLALVVLLLTIPAVPTVAIDVYNAQDVDNRAWGPQFPWTLIITPEERESLEWLKRSTPPDAVVQVDAHFRGSAYWAYLPAFAERRMAAGLPGAMIPVEKFVQATQAVRAGIFNVGDPVQAHAMAAYLGIDYIYIGEIERRFYRPMTEAMTARSDLFPTAFHNATVTILAVAEKR